jgi:hypothetical protein
MESLISCYPHYKLVIAQSKNRRELPTSLYTQCHSPDMIVWQSAIPTGQICPIVVSLPQFGPLFAGGSFGGTQVRLNIHCFCCLSPHQLSLTSSLRSTSTGHDTAPTTFRQPLHPVIAFKYSAHPPTNTPSIERTGCEYLHS